MVCPKVIHLMRDHLPTTRLKVTFYLLDTGSAKLHENSSNTRGVDVGNQPSLSGFTYLKKNTFLTL